MSAFYTTISFINSNNSQSLTSVTKVVEEVVNNDKLGVDPKAINGGVNSRTM